ncbi:glycohydrolase toxin TNT-related protein [Thioclava sp. GXIMD4215]|uniref:glycohydrolase toxin TNT-related protein n=1 Tax=Thioclava sp. GXIMD4215 TaxID=3131928 RepID=UPI00311AC49E
MEAERLSHPNYFLTGEIAGAIPTIFIPVGGAAGAAAGGGARAMSASGARTGAVLGGISGAGHDEGGVLDRLDGAAMGAVTGGFAGAVLSGAGVLVAKGFAKTRIWARVRPKTRVPPDRKPWYRKDLGDEWFDPDTGELRWPPNDGFDAAPTSETLSPGTRLDRFSSRVGLDDTGRYLSPEGADFSSRALPYDISTQQHAVYEVMQDLPVSAGKAAPWFGETGGATQYMLDRPLNELIENQIIRQVSP